MAKDFFQGMKTEHEDFAEKVACAEHFVRLKKQAGLQKQAFAGQTFGPNDPLPASMQGKTVTRVGSPQQVKLSTMEKCEGCGMEKDSCMCSSKKKQAMSEQQAMGLAMGIGGAIGAGGTYLSSRPQKDLGGKSREEDRLEGAVAQQRKNPETGFSRKVLNRTTELSHGLAKAFREHPAQATAVGAAGGALAGMGVGKLLGLALKAKGGK